MTDQIHRILTRVQKPARYVGGEYNQIVKQKPDVDVRVAFCFPDTYEIGMSNIGMRILYGVMNEMPGVWCERVFAPWGDMEAEMRAHRLPLWALESHDPVRDFDLVAFTLGYEMCYSNVLNMLELSGLPLLAKDRKGLEGIVFAGGVCTVNPEPLADFIDFFSIGEGEESTREIIECYRAAKRQGLSKQEFLREAAKLEGVYVPSLYTHTYNPDGTLAAITPAPGAPAHVKKRIVQDLDRAYFPTKTIVPSTQIVHDRSNLEIFRGCIRGCRFCQAGFCYRPIRAKSADTLCRQAIESLEDSGNSEITLASLSTSDYRELEALADGLLRYCEPRKINLSLPSLRADNFSRELMLRIQKVRKSGLTFAPEAGTQRLRDAINKNVTEEEILSTCATAFSGGWNSVKLYFMLGLPTETDEDVIGIAELVYKILQVWRENGNGKKRGLSINLATAYFVPKPFTPFQWAAQITPEEYLRRVHLLQANLHAKCVDYRYHESDLSRLEAVMARGDRRVGRALLEAHNLGCRLDGWDEYFDYEKWLEAFRRAGLDPDFYTTRGYGVDEILPWQTIDVGVTTNFLLREREKALRSESTPDCRTHCNGCGARRLSERGCAMNRLLFEKTGDAVYISHLDLMRIFQRAFKRADIMIWHSQGFSPRAYVSIALPLPVGSESCCEILDFEIQDGSVDLEKLPALLNRTMPAGIRVLRAYESAVKIRHLTRLQAEITLEYDAGVPETAQSRIAALFSGGPVLVKKRTKSGGEAELDLQPMIFACSLRQPSRQELELTVLVSAQNPSCNPQLLVNAIEAYLPECKPDFARIRRLEVYDEQGEPFR